MIKSLENFPLAPGRDSRPLVSHTDDDSISSMGRSEANRSAARIPLDGIRNQVHQHLDGAARIGLHFRHPIMRLHFDALSVFIRQWLHGLHCFHQDIGDIHGSRVHPEAAGLDAGAFQQVVDQGLQAQHPKVDGIQQFGKLLRFQLRQLVQQQLNRCCQGRERGAELVGNVCQKFTQQPANSLLVTDIPQQ